MIYNDAKSAFADLKNLTFMISDSRALTDPVHTVFAAVRTATGDGHRYISDMYLRGVSDSVWRPAREMFPGRSMMSV